MMILTRANVINPFHLSALQLQRHHPILIDPSSRPYHHHHLIIQSTHTLSIYSLNPYPYYYQQMTLYLEQSHIIYNNDTISILTTIIIFLVKAFIILV